MKIDLTKIYHVYLIGIGGIGMSALARYFHAQRIAVAGYDLTLSPLTKELEDLGIAIHYKEAIEHIPPKITQEKQFSLVIYTPAIPTENKELNWLKKEGVTILKRSEILGILTQKYKTIAVAGTHGKTTTSSMIAHVMAQSSIKCNAFLGGIATNYNSNLILNEKAKYVVVEADEFDRSFLTLNPTIAVVTSTDADHLDVYGDKTNLEESFQLFVNKLPANGLLVKEQKVQLKYNNVQTYSLHNNKTAYKIDDLKDTNGNFEFTAITPSQNIKGISMGISGLHNIENALATIAVCQYIGIKNQEIKQGLNTYKGVKRRFEYHIKTPQLVFIDDYAHHPNEIKALIGSVRELYKDKKITGVFQPHLFSRTRDFLADFAAELSKLDETILLDIYPAREKPIEGITSQLLASKITNKVTVISKDKLIETIKQNKPQVLLTIGAGDIDRLVMPIKQVLQTELQVEL